MYEYLENNEAYRTVGSFVQDKNKDFKNGCVNLFESFKDAYSTDAATDIVKILRMPTLKECYKDKLLGDVMESTFEDKYYAGLAPKLEQLFENTALDIVKESNLGQIAPIVGLTLPILKKNFIECHAKDIVMTEVPTKNIIRVAFERKFLKDKAGKPHYIPDIFYNDEYKTILDASQGKKIDDSFYPTDVSATLPIQDLPILNLSGGSLEARDSLAYSFSIEAVKMEVLSANGTDKEIIEITGLEIKPDMTTGSFSSRIKGYGKDSATTAVFDVITGQVNFYDGTVSVASTGGAIKKVKFGGRLSNENNMNTSELDRERTIREWQIPDGLRINTGLTVERIKDYNVLANIDITADVISDMSQVMTQFEDSAILDFLNESYNKWLGKTDLPFGYTGGFVRKSVFSCTPPTNKYVTDSQWINTELKFYLNRLIDDMKQILKNQDMMFVVYGNPANVTLIQDDVKWIINEDSNVGGVQLEYKFGVITNNQNRIHVVSTMKAPKDLGLRIIAYPTSNEVITFKHYKYSLNIENAYRNPYTPLSPNIMGTSRYKTVELLPVQGKFELTNNSFGMQ